MRRGIPKICLKDCTAAVDDLHARMPFRYGEAVLTAVPVLTVRVTIESSAKRLAVGHAADCLPPLWFDKDSSKGFRKNVEEQIAAYRAASRVYLDAGSTPRTCEGLWKDAYPRVVEEGRRLGLNALTASFGSSFLERAIIDAVCRLRGLSLFELLQQDLLGMKTSKDLPDSPADSIVCRHTVGLGDPLTISEIPEEERLNDGLPQALEEDIELYGVHYFKIKLRGDHDRDVTRLSRLGVLLGQRCRDGYRVTLDGNEQYRDLADLERLIERVRSLPYGDALFDSTLFIEQPLHRDVALDPSAAGDVRRLSELKPIVIDESDDSPDAFKKAVDLGYRGVSHKNCKGVFKSLKNRSLIRRLNAEAGKALYIQTAEDLATVPVVPLQQDLAAVIALGIEHVERNGHHYFRGLEHLPPAEAARALEVHADLYEEREGSAFLRIQDGVIATQSIQQPGFGYACDLAFEERTPLDQWSFDRLETG